MNSSRRRDIREFKVETIDRVSAAGRIELR